MIIKQDCFNILISLQYNSLRILAHIQLEKSVVYREQRSNGLWAFSVLVKNIAALDKNKMLWHSFSPRAQPF